MCGSTFPATKEFFYSAKRKTGPGLDTRCKACSAAQAKAWREKNPERHASNNKKWAEANPERMYEKNKRWCRENPERRKVSSVKYRKNHPDADKGRSAAWRAKNPKRASEHIRSANKRRRAALAAVPSEPYTDQQVLDLYGTDCYLCHEPIDLTAPRKVGKSGWERGLHIDHVIPLIKKGPDTLANVRPTHGKCNQKKFIRTYDKTVNL